MEIEIEENIPVPKKQSGARAKYPYRDMKVGQSFWTDKKQTTISNSVAWCSMRHPMKFTTRVETKDGVKGTRVWRVE